MECWVYLSGQNGKAMMLSKCIARKLQNNNSDRLAAYTFPFFHFLSKGWKQGWQFFRAKQKGLTIFIISP